MGGNLFKASAASGDPLTGNPRRERNRASESGLLEQSNVSVVEEMVNMIVAQRAYEVNSKAVKVADDMLSQINNLVR
jgi:flagellar basal-body rod protein FlgG